MVDVWAQHPRRRTQSKEEREITEAIRRGARERSERAEPKDVEYDPKTGDIVISFVGGSSFRVPARSLQGMEHASDAELGDVRLRGETGLHWPRLDADFSIVNLMAGMLGSERFMEAKRRQSS